MSQQDERQAQRQCKTAGRKIARARDERGVSMQNHACVQENCCKKRRSGAEADFVTERVKS